MRSSKKRLRRWISGTNKRAQFSARVYSDFTELSETCHELDERHPVDIKRSGERMFHWYQQVLSETCRRLPDGFDPNVSVRLPGRGKPQFVFHPRVFWSQRIRQLFTRASIRMGGTFSLLGIEYPSAHEAAEQLLMRLESLRQRIEPKMLSGQDAATAEAAWLKLWGRWDPAHEGFVVSHVVTPDSCLSAASQEEVASINCLSLQNRLYSEAIAASEIAGLYENRLFNPGLTPPFDELSFSAVALRKKLGGISQTTLRTYLKAAGVPCAKKGQRNHRYSAAHARTLFDYVRNRSGADEATVERAIAAEKEIVKEIAKLQI